MYPVAQNRLGFKLLASEIKNRILVPKYYDPEIETDLTALKEDT